MKLAKREKVELTVLSVIMLLLLTLYISVTMRYESASADMIANVPQAYEQFKALSMPREWMYQICRDSWVVLAIITIAKSASGKVPSLAGYVFLAFNMLLGSLILLLCWNVLNFPRSILQTTIIYSGIKACIIFSIPLLWNFICHMIGTLAHKMCKIKEM